jgi:hypothetical protein
MLAPVIEALKEQRKNKIVGVYFLKRRRLYETRHTFATLMLDGGELPGWVQWMMGHETLQMIHERSYSYIKNYQRANGSAFMEKVYKPCADPDKVAPREKGTGEKFTPNLRQEEIRESIRNANSLKLLEKINLSMVRKAGLEPAHCSVFSLS